MGVVRKFKHLQRYRQIAVAFVRYGFGYVVKELGLPEPRASERKEMRQRTIGERIRLFLEELGPTFVKLGQIASIRPDLIPAAVIAELEKLQDQVPAFSYEEAAQIIEDELGEPISALFAEFDRKPLASASIGQVYRAVLANGTTVAVKVQRPGIRAVIETDLDIMAELARLAESRMEWARNYKVREVIEEIAKALRVELDYATEARNAEKFAAQRSRTDDIRIPEVYWDYCTGRVLTMEFIEGIKLSDRVRLDEEGHDRRRVAELFSKAILNQVLLEGFFHGDPHPGNALVLPDGRLALLDFGMVGRLSPDMMRHFASFVIALRNQSTNGVIRAISKLGLVSEEADLSALRADVDELRDKYYKVPLSQVSMGETVNDFFALAFRHRIRVPSEMTVLGKTLLTMEGVVKSLDPGFSVFDAAEPFGRRLFWERFDPRHAARRWLESIPDYMELLSEVPVKLRDLMSLARKGKLRLEITAPELADFMHKMDRLINRLSFSIVLLSFSIVMAGLIIGSSMDHRTTVLWNIPAVEIGFGIASFMILWLLYAIFRSGRL